MLLCDWGLWAPATHEHSPLGGAKVHEGLYNGMGHRPQTLLEVGMYTLADTFLLG
ncbi:hypothetical protein ACWC9U_15445 [Streptomyces sp. 900116325]